VTGVQTCALPICEEKKEERKNCGNNTEQDVVRREEAINRLILFRNEVIIVTNN